MSTIFRDRSRVDAMTSHVETHSRIMDRTVGKTTFRSGLLPQDSNSLNMQFANSNNVGYMPDQSHKTSAVSSTTFGMRSLGFRSQNLTSHSSEIIPEGRFRLNHDIMQRNNNMSSIQNISKTFWPAVRNTTLTTGLQMQDRVRINNDIMDNSGFRRPTLAREIRGRNSTLSSRLFHPQNTDRHYKDLSNINGFNVSHISRRDVDHLSESRLALHMRNNCVDNQSISGSVYSFASMKAQFMNLLENLHHSILSIGPHLTSEAVRLHFDKAKQGLENLNEMSFAPTVRPADAASVISQSCKSICPPLNESVASNTINGGLLHLKSSKDLLKMLISSKDNYKDKHKVSTCTEVMDEKDEVITSSQNNESDDEESSSLVFKKPRACVQKGKVSQILKMKASKTVKNLISKGTNKVINLKQWYPLAVGSDLVFTGVNEKGGPAKTDAVKKRLNNRKVELISGLHCNLIGSPSPKISVLPQAVAKLLKNGLTDRWRVLQKELLNCQTDEEGNKKRKSKSPTVKSPRGKKTKVETPEGNVNTVDLKKAKVTNTPGKNTKIYTRSGRAVKPPAMFWVVATEGETESALSKSHKSPEKKGRKDHEESFLNKSKEAVSLSVNKKPRKVDKESSRKKPQKIDESPSRKVTASEIDDAPRKIKSDGKKRVVASPKKRQSEAESSKQSKRKGRKEEVKVHESVEDAKREIKTRHSPGKRKREVTRDMDSAQEKKTENGLDLSLRSPKPKRQKLPQAKNKKERVRKKTVKNAVIMQESINQAGDLSEMESNFDFNLDDIGIPEIANVSGNPQLSRSQLRVACLETPPLKYFNSNLKFMGSATPVQSPDWFISQRTQSEVKQFQRRREEAFKKKVTTNVKKTVIMEKSKNVQSKDVKKMLEWLDEKTVRSPQWASKVLQYVIPSRKQMEEEQEDKDSET